MSELERPQIPHSPQSTEPLTCYPCFLALLAFVVITLGALISPIGRALVVMGVSAYIGFFLVVYLVISLGYTSEAVPPKHEMRDVLAKSSLGMLLGTLLFGPLWLIGLLIYLVVVAGGLIWFETLRSPTS